MEKSVAILIIFLLTLPQIVFSSVEGNVTFKQGNINYIFLNKTDADFRVLNQGIVLDDYKLVFDIQGGELDILVYNWDTKEMGFISSVPQKILFSISQNGEKYYVYDYDTYSIDSYQIKDEINWTIKSLSNDIKESKKFEGLVSENNNKTNNTDWMSKKLFFFKVPELVLEKDIIKEKYFYFANFHLLILFSLVIIGVLIWIYKKN